MVELTDIQTNIQNSLIQAILCGNLLEVQNMFKDSEDSNIQKILRLEWISNELRNTVLRVAIDSYNIQDQEKAIEIIELIWQKADQRTRDFLCSAEYDSAEGGSVSTINMLRDLQGQGRTNDSNNGLVLGEVIQEMEEHKRVMGLDSNLQEAIENLDIDQVKAALENCGEDIEKVLMQNVDWSDSTDSDYLLIYPLIIDYDRELNQENAKKIKEIIKLLWDKASPDVRNFWLEDHMVNSKGQNTGDNYIIDSLEEQQKKYANIAGERWLEDFIQEVKDYRKQKDIESNNHILEEEDKQALELAKQESLLTAPIATNTTAPTTGNKATEKNGTNSAGTKNVTATSTNGSKTPAKNDTTFWSEHKGKIALGVTGLCVAGAVAAYMLAYPVVALALTVLAAVILMGAGIAKVLEDPSVEKTFTQQQKA